MSKIKEQDSQQKGFEQADREKQQKSMQAQQQAAEKNKSLEKKVVGPGAGEVTKEKKDIKKKKSVTKLPDGSGFFVGTVENTIKIEGNILSSYLEFVQEVSPPGWEGTVKKMKKKRGIKNVWALGWWMRKKGYNPHYTKSGKKK